MEVVGFEETELALVPFQIAGNDAVGQELAAQGIAFGSEIVAAQDYDLIGAAMGKPK